MTQKPHTTVATRMSGIREDWLRLTQEEILEPDLPIVDPHHHLWDFPAHRYLLPDLLADTGSGHRIEQTVFIECTACYRADGPPELRTLGETEFVNGIAAMSASGGYGPTRVAAGIVGLVDLTMGARAEEILRAHMAAAGPRFKGIRHAAAWEDKAEEIHNSPHQSRPASLSRPRQVPRRLRRAGPARAHVRCLALPSPDRRPHRAGARLPAADRSCSTMSADRWDLAGMRASATRSSPTGGATSRSWQAAPTCS